jgi:hypothetical protein
MVRLLKLIDRYSRTVLYAWIGTMTQFGKDASIKMFWQKLIRNMKIMKVLEIIKILEIAQPLSEYSAQWLSKLKWCQISLNFLLIWAHFLTKSLYFLNLYITSYHILLSLVRTFYIENDAEIFPAHCTWKVAEKGFKIAFMMNKLSQFLWNYSWKRKGKCCQKSLWNSGVHFTCICIVLDKMRSSFT